MSTIPRSSASDFLTSASASVSAVCARSRSIATSAILPGLLEQLELVRPTFLSFGGIQAERPEHVAVLRQERHGPCRSKAMLQGPAGDTPRPDRTTADRWRCRDHDAFLAKRRRAALPMPDAIGSGLIERFQSSGTRRPAAGHRRCRRDPRAGPLRPGPDRARRCRHTGRRGPPPERRRQRSVRAFADGSTSAHPETAARWRRVPEHSSVRPCGSSGRRRDSRRASAARLPKAQSRRKALRVFNP